MRSAACFCWCLLSVLTVPHLGGAEIGAPLVKDPQLELTLFTAEPDIVTPVGIAIDKRGRLYVVESHTHFPKQNYPGPKRDRVKIFDDTNRDNRADKIFVFAEDLYHSMNLAFSPDGNLYLTHRNGVIILHDKDSDGVSESRSTVLHLDTPGNYPHNGIGGIAFSADGWLYVGMGENLGEKYTLKGSDGSSHSGGGEGGNVFRCRPDGSDLKLVATGFWNAFALAFNRAGILFCVDNDPDSRPPCRLLDVVDGADFGYKFRFGRSGLHPFTAWNGELPGTLPMVAGTGEAPSGILDCDFARLTPDYRGTILVTSWGDHAIERYRPTPVGASVRAAREVIVQGNEWFRPVGIAAAPDGTVYFTDWVDKEYSVHQKGRIWRLTSKQGVKADIPANASRKPEIHAERKRMRGLAQADSPREFNQLLKTLQDDDPFMRSAAVTTLARPIFRERVLTEINSRNADVRLGALLALRRAKYEQPVPLLRKLLADPDERVRLLAVVWAGEESLAELAGDLRTVLSAGPVSTALFRAYTSAAEILHKGRQPVKAGARDTARPAVVQTLEMIDNLRRDSESAIRLLENPSRDLPLKLRLEAVRSLAEFPVAQAHSLLVKLATDRRNPAELRAEAVLASAAQPADAPVQLVSLLDDPVESVAVEAARALRLAASRPDIRNGLEKKHRRLAESGRKSPLFEQLTLALHPIAAGQAGAGDYPSARPASDEEWRKALAGDGDVNAGRRIFFSPAVGCAKCHRIEDHGGRTGTDLSTIALSADREKLMQSILNPSREIAPQFVAHTVETKDGQTYTGALLGQGTDGSLTLLGADGKGVLVPAEQIAAKQTSTLSLMPEALEEMMTVQDFRDLLVFLLSRM